MRINKRYYCPFQNSRSYLMRSSHFVLPRQSDCAKFNLAAPIRFNILPNLSRFTKYVQEKPHFLDLSTCLRSTHTTPMMKNLQHSFYCRTVNVEISCNISPWITIHKEIYNTPFEIYAKRPTHYENYGCKRLQVRKANLKTCASTFLFFGGFNCLFIMYTYVL